jgi:hypothetical protein
MTKEERIKYFTEKQGYKILGTNRNGDTLLYLKHGNGSMTKIIVYSDGSWDTF